MPIRTCARCGMKTDNPNASSCSGCGAALEMPPPLPPTLPPPPGSRQYKVITQRDGYFASKFNPDALQNLLNVHAAQGWRVVSMTATDVGSFMGSFWGKGGGSARQELIVLLERTI